MESFNRKPKDTKRVSRKYINFDFARNRIIFFCRKNAPICAIPKTNEKIHSYRGKSGGKYTKK